MPIALVAIDAPKRVKPSNYPEPFASQMQGREKRPLGDLFGVTNFDVNLTQLAPGAVSALRLALENGTVLEVGLRDKPYGDRQGGVKDEHGNIWWVSQRIVEEPYTP